MSNVEALRAAFELLRLPSQVRIARARPLPCGAVFLLRLAARDRDAEQDAQRFTAQTVESNRQAATFFIEQILFSPDADSLRILGFDSAVPLPQLRRHMALLLKWLHPDTGSDEHRSKLARRVIEAWNDLKVHSRAPQRASAPRFSLGTPSRTTDALAIRAHSVVRVGRRRSRTSYLAEGWRLRRILQSCLRRTGRRAHFMLSD